MKKIIPLTLLLLLTVSTLFSGCDYEYMDEGESSTDTYTEIYEDPDYYDDNSNYYDENQSGDFPLYDVVRVVDGDTIVIDFDGYDEKVRLIGVDTPESVHPDKERNSEFGEQVSKYSKSQLSGKSVGIEFDVRERDQYGRLLAYVYVGEDMYNKQLLEKGYASVATFPPNVKYVDEFTAIQKKARENKVGMWAEGFSTEKSSSSKSSQSKNKNSTGTYSGKYKGHTGSRKFHEAGCRYGEMISDDNLRIFKTRDAAIDEGYAPCKVCNP